MRGQPTGAKHEPQDLLAPPRPGHRLDPGDRFLDGILDALHLDLVVVDDRVAGARVAVARQAHAAGVQDDDAVDLDVELNVGMAHANDVGVDVLQPLGPGLRVFEQVLVERVARGGVNHQDSACPRA